jgi:hypothetical protein
MNLLIDPCGWLTKRSTEDNDEFRKNLSKLLELDAPLQSFVDLWGNLGYDNHILWFCIMVERSRKSF